MKLLKLINSVGIVLKTLFFLYIHDRSSLEYVKKYQFRKLQNLINFAWNNIPFYRKYWENEGFNPSCFMKIEDVQKIPYLDKNMVRQNLEEMLPKYTNQCNLSLVSTGGTTGMPMKFYIDNYKARAKELAYQLFVNYNYFGYKQCLDRVVVLRGNRVKDCLIENGIFWQFDIFENALIMSSFHLTSETYCDYRNKLIKFSPRYIKAYPSSIVALCLLIKKHGGIQIPKLKGVICSSENIYDWQRVLVKEVLGVRIYSYYGHSEKSVLGYQCNELSYTKFSPYYGFTEFINNTNEYCKVDNEVGQVVVTSFDNKYFPFIRYKTEDLIEYANYDSFVVKRILGRKQEFVYNKNHDSILFTCADEIFWDVEGIVAYQYLQNEYGKLTILLQADTEIQNSILEKIKEEAFRVFVDFDVKVIQVSHIERTNTGKFKYLIQNIKVDY